MALMQTTVGIAYKFYNYDLSNPEHRKAMAQVFVLAAILKQAAQYTETLTYITIGGDMGPKKGKGCRVQINMVLQSPILIANDENPLDVAKKHFQALFRTSEITIVRDDVISQAINLAKGGNVENLDDAICAWFP